MGKLLKGSLQVTAAPDAPAGAYHFEVGLYLLRTMERLPTTWGDKVRLGRLRVEAKG